MTITGQIIRNTDPGFDAAIMGTLFNKIDPGQRPMMMVTPRTVDDIIAAVRHAKATGLKISVCSGGHSWSANHVRQGSILINMSGFDTYAIDREAMMATAGPGVGGSTLLGELFKRDLFFPAGHCKGVCIGGYLLQGGYAWNGRKLGMACESVLGVDMVTAAGEYVHASATENPDLYWAVRGSGGGFFGVVVRFHLRIYPRPQHCGFMLDVFDVKYIEEVFEWVAEVGPTVLPAVEFQMITSRESARIFGPGIEVTATIFADSKDELHEATAFMRDNPIRQKATIRSPYVPVVPPVLYAMAMTHYPSDHYWNVDNMWTHAPVRELMPHLHRIVATMPPPPAHMLWLNWFPPAQRPDMAYSVEDSVYIALYGSWGDAADTAKYGNWATGLMQEMAHLSTGVQLADENLHRRPGRFLAEANLHQFDAIKAQRDPDDLFNAWHRRPQLV
jgi:FAD binding domain